MEKVVSRTRHADVSLKSGTVIKKGYNAQFNKCGKKKFWWVLSHHSQN